MDWDLVINRISARPQGREPSLALLGKAHYLLGALEMRGVRVLNGERCYRIATSKALQAACLEKLGLPVPATRLVSETELGRWGMMEDGYLLKPNAGGFGEGITHPGAFSREAFQPDALAVVQELVKSRDQKIHRVELIGGGIVYHASRPLEPGLFDYCLGRGDSPVHIEACSTPTIRAECEKIARAVGMDFGSVEYLVNSEGRAEYIDINPVSSYHPEVETFLGFDPTQRLADFIEKRYRFSGS